MGKQKVVISISMRDQKARTKAFKIAVSLSGVDSASIEADKGKLEVIGDFDPVTLANQLRKKLGQVELLSVASVEKKEEKNAAYETPMPQTMTITYDPSHNYALHHQYPYYVYPVQEYHQPGCSIM